MKIRAGGVSDPAVRSVYRYRQCNHALAYPQTGDEFMNKLILAAFATAFAANVAIAQPVAEANGVLAASARAQSPGSTLQIPDKLKPGDNESLALIAIAKGAQIYECRAKKDQAGTYEWAFVAPEAELFDAGGNRIGHHYAGPSWESNDGSKVQGTATASAAAPAADAIPWLLLAAKPAGAEGAFSKVTSVQRVSTVGGVAPKGGCSQAAAGTFARIGYTAEYRFFTKG